MLIIPKNLPPELVERPQWVLWTYADRGSPKLTKIPLQARSTLYPAKTTDPRSWATFETALKMWQHHGAHVSGVGFVFALDDPFTGVDLDNIWPSDASETAPWAAGILQRFSDSYSEQSPSDCGVKIWCRAKAPRSGSWKIEGGSVEVYSEARFFTVTGRHAGVLTVTDHQSDIEALITNLDGGIASSRRPEIPAGGKIPHGTQHNFLISIAGTMRRRGVGDEAIEAALLAINKTQLERPGPEANIRRIVQSTRRWQQ